jgi:hypothetical protein
LSKEQFVGVGKCRVLCVPCATFSTHSFPKNLQPLTRNLQRLPHGGH